MIKINFDKAREISHERRRAARSVELAPLDDVIAKQIPGQAIDAEAKRATIRQRYQKLQKDIDAAKTVDALHKIVTSKL